MQRFALLAILMFASLRSSARLDSLLRWKVTSELFQLCYLNANVSVERIIKHGSHGVLLAYRPNMRNGGEVRGAHGLFGDYSMQNSWNWLYQCISLGTTHKIQLDRSKRSFFQIDMIYRHWWFDRRWASYPNVEGYRFDGLRSEKQDVLAIKALFGGSRWWGGPGRGNRRFFVESYAGLGWRWRTQRYLTHSGTVYEEERSEYSETYRNALPSIHFGVRLGMAWGRDPVIR